MSTNKAPNHKRFLIGTTSSDGFTYDEFSDWWQSEYPETELPSDNSDEFFNWCADEAYDNWTADLENVKYENSYNVPVVLTGQLGLWDGQHTIYPEKFNSVREAVDKIIKNGANSAYCDFDIFYDNGMIEVQHHHHDGTNTFEIHALSKKGIAKCRTAEEHWEDIPRLKKHDLKRLKYLYA